MGVDKQRQDPQVEANAIIIRCIEEGLGTMGGTAAAIQYVESISGMTLTEIPQHSEAFVMSLRHLFRFGSIVVLKNIVVRLDEADSDSREVLGRVRTFSISLTEGIKSIESGIV